MITIGLDFGTHQTKVCIEDRRDRLHPIYSFLPFINNAGEKTFILPSIIQINSDETLSYGFVDESISKYGAKYKVAARPAFPKKSDFPFKEINEDLLPPCPLRPGISEVMPEGLNEKEAAEWIKKKEIRDKKYDSEVAAWERKCNMIRNKINGENSFVEKQYQSSVREWYKWQNLNAARYRLIYRYFKQASFSDYNWNCTIDSDLLSIWYLANILFDIEERYGTDFAVQMGIPTGAEKFQFKKYKAVILLLSAYRLVEEVFQNDKEAFLKTKIGDLIKLTEIVTYDKEKKEEYSILVFPEAYASLKSLTYREKIEPGMSLMIDIGGGTTDISFFTIDKKAKKPRIYNYLSIPYGINYIYETAHHSSMDKLEVRLNLDDKSINKKKLDGAVKQYNSIVTKVCHDLIEALFVKFQATNFQRHKLNAALMGRPVFYSGGGSTYKFLRNTIDGKFSDVNHINPKVWEGMQIQEINEVCKVCPIVSTALGLSISEIDDRNIELYSMDEIFKNMRNEEQIRNAYEYEDSRGAI